MLKTLFRIFLLNIFAGSCLLILFIFPNETASQFYYSEIARNSINFKDLIIYALSLIVYALSVELILRRFLQEKIHNAKFRYGTAAAIILPAFVYSLIHLRYGLIPCVYSLLVGMVVGVAYWKFRDWKVLAMWHIQWDLTALSFTIFLAMLGTPGITESFMQVYKSEQIAQGKIVFDENWGWLDPSHMDEDVYNKIASHIESGKDLVKLKHHYTTAFGTDSFVNAAYKINYTKASFNEQEKWALCSSVYFDFMTRVEKSQEEALWIFGVKPSAWQPEDLPSTLYHCLNKNPLQTSEQTDSTIELLPASNAVAVNREYVSRRVDEQNIRAHIPKNYTQSFNEIIACKKFWQVL